MHGAVSFCPLLKFCQQKGTNNYGAPEGHGFLQTISATGKQAKLMAIAAVFTGGQPFSVKAALRPFPTVSEMFIHCSSQPCKLVAVGRYFMSFVPLTLDFKQADHSFVLLWGLN